MGAELDYAIEVDTCDTATTAVWVHPPSLAAMSSLDLIMHGFLNRGIQSFDVSASSDGQDFVMVYDDFQLEMADAGVTHAAKTYPFMVDEVRYLRLTNLQTFDVGSGNGGFAEIQFDGVASP